MAILAAFAVPHPPLIIPEIGRGQEKEIQRTVSAYEEAAAAIGALRPDTIVLLSPHQTMYADYFHISPGKIAYGDFGRFRAGSVKLRVTYDEEFTTKLCAIADEKDLPAGVMGEREKNLDHGTMVPLYFVEKYWNDYRLVRIGLSGLPLAKHYELGKCIKETAEKLDRRIVLIASGDLSHRLKEDGPYGYREEGPLYDARVTDALGRGAFGELLDFSEDFCEKAGECGHRSFVIMAGALDKTAVEAKLLSYEGPFGVGYGICAFQAQGEAPARNFLAQYREREKQKLHEIKEREDAYVRLARRTVEEYVRTGRRPEIPDDLAPEMLKRRAGVFVSIKEDGRLRGCIGTIRATRDCIAQEIIENAVSAASRDPRFSPIEEWELDALRISVDVLGDTEKIDSASELDVKRYGVIVTKGHKRGLLLPNLEGVDTVEEQIAIAKRKAGIRDHEEAELERFEVVRHE